MPDEITELRKLAEAYRRRSTAAPFNPVAAAYAEAADQLDEMIAGLARLHQIENRRQA